MRICKLPRNILHRLDSRQFSVYRKISPDETRSPFADFSKIEYVYATQTQTFYSNILDEVPNKNIFIAGNQYCSIPNFCLQIQFFEPGFWK